MLWEGPNGAHCLSPSSLLSLQARSWGPEQSALWTSHVPRDQARFTDQQPWPFWACSRLTRCQPGLSRCLSHRLLGPSVLFSASPPPAFVHLHSPYIALSTWARESWDLLQQEARLVKPNLPTPRALGLWLPEVAEVSLIGP